MKSQKTLKKIYLICAFLFLSSCVYAAFDSNDITKDSVGLTALNFYQALISKDPKQRQAASLYLLGVLDVTEGDLWCDYKTFKTTTLRARLYEELKKVDPGELKVRASNKIKDILAKKYPCERQK